MSFDKWEKYKLGEVTIWKSGGTPPKMNDNFWDGDIPWISAKNLVGNRIYDSNVKITEEGLQKGSKLANINSILLLVRGSGLFNRIPVAIVKKPVAFNQDIKEIIAIKEVLSPEFLLYWFESITNILGNKLEETGIGAGKFDTEILKNLEIYIPTFYIQESIISKIRAIDDKIELNRQTNKTLETIAQMLFKEMCLPKGDDLPEGWEVKKLEDLIDTISVTHKMKQEKIIFLNTSDILEGNVLNSGYSVVATLPGQAKKSIKRNDILFSEIRPANKRFAFVNFDADDYVVSTKLMVLRSKGDISPYLIYCFLTNNDTLNQLQHLAETRSGTFPQITFNQLKDFQLVIPDNNKLKELSENIQSIYEMIFSNSKENQTLTTLRDSLLPKLMKGEIEV